MAEFLTFYRVDVISPFYLLPSSAPFSHCHCSPLFFMHIYKIIMAITMLSGSDTDLCPREMQGPAMAPPCCCWLEGLQHRGQWALLSSEGAAEPLLGTPILRVPLGTQGDTSELPPHLCFVKPLQLLLFNQLLCLLLQLPSLSESPFCL